MQGAEADAEFAGGVGAVAAVAAESFLDGAPLEIVDIESSGGSGIHLSWFRKREVLGKDVAVAQDGGPFDDIFQLADVARAALRAEPEAGGIGEAELRLAELCCGRGDEVLGEGVNIGGAFAERRDFDGERPEPEIEVGAEATFLNLTAEVPVGGRDDADVGFQGLLASEALEAFFLNDAEELGLQAGIEFADLIEEQRAAAGAFEDAVAAGNGAGEGAAFVTEELAFDESGREGGAVDREERPAGAAAVDVDAAGDGLLGDSAFTKEEIVDSGGRDLGEKRQNVQHAGIACHRGCTEAGGTHGQSRRGRVLRIRWKGRGRGGRGGEVPPGCPAASPDSRARRASSPRRRWRPSQRR